MKIYDYEYLWVWKNSIMKKFHYEHLQLGKNNPYEVLRLWKNTKKMGTVTNTSEGGED